MIAIRLLVDGAVVREGVFREGSALIGRGPESDFPVVDPSVSRRHARVRTDEVGAVWIEDAGSRNGLRTGAGRVERAAVPAGGTLRCWLGAVEVELAVAGADATVEIAAPAASAHGAVRALKALALWAAGIAAWAGLILIDPGFWSPWEQDRLAKFSWVALTVSVFLPVVAFVLIGLLRIVGRRAPVGDALRALAVVSWGWVLLVLLDSAASYALRVPAHAMLEAVLRNGGAIVTIAYLASVGRAGRGRRFFAVWAAAVAVLLVGFNAAGRLAARQAGTPQLDYDLGVPIGGGTGPASGLDAYLEGVRADFTVAEQRAEEDRPTSHSAPP